MENLRNRMNVELVQTEKRMKKLISSPSFHAYIVFNDDLVGVHSKQKTLKLNRPIFTGASILDLSKHLMYDFHYNFTKTKYETDATLLFTDTDSLCYEVECDDYYEDMKKNIDFFDTSDYPADHKTFSNKNKKVVGKMKDEMAAIPIKEFVGLKSKMYSIDTGVFQKKTAKGVARVALKKKISHEDYRRCALETTQTRVESTKFFNDKHQIFTVNTNKLALNPYDDKRYILKDGISTLSHGNYKIPFF